jgi:hypothetical protein
MARRYAGILALVGMSVVLIRSLKNGSSVESAVMASLGGMMVLGLVGMIVGAVAQATIEESVRSQIERDLAKNSAA